MVTISGTSILADISIGKLKFYQEPQVTAAEGRGPVAERGRLADAYVQTREHLARLYRAALEEAGEKDAAIFEIHQMLLEDEDFQNAVGERIENGFSAEYAVWQAGDSIARTFLRLDGSAQDRAADIRDVASQLVRVLSSAKELILDEPIILMAEDISPSAAVQLDKSKLLGFVMRGGTVNSHTAILSRTMNIPALVQTTIRPEWDGTMAVIDGVNGRLYVEPDQDTLKEMEQAKKRLEQRRRRLQALRGTKAITRDGKEILIYANVNSVEETEFALENDAQGIGLFRSEFIYLNRDRFPTEEEQFQIYRKTLELMGDRKVIVRTLDIGADKQIRYFHQDAEENPALGYRGIRICLDHTDIFKTQLRALLRASIHGNLSVMYPMITSVGEVREIKQIVQETYRQLQEENVPCSMVKQGVMIETPAAAIMSDQLAENVDFFCIGTNDLTQFTLAADRQNSKLDRYCNSHHPAVFRLIQSVVEAGHKAGIWVGICGELGADLSLTRQFLELSVDELSVAPSSILVLKDYVRTLNLKNDIP